MEAEFMGVAVGVAAALGEPVKIAQATGFANTRRAGGGATGTSGTDVSRDDRPVCCCLRQMRALCPFDSIYLTSINLFSLNI
ncbi:hypothetical protein PUN4_1610007 [Paraburkholderia unamae]|nr:hypothetical protein PUN4_1610007 [Paraburkholderia unamae]